MSASKLNLGILTAAIALATCLSASPAQAAPLPVATSNYSLTFQDGWSLFPFGNDSLKFIMNDSLGATCYMMAITQAQPLSAQQIAAYMAMYGASGNVVQSGTGAKTLGGKSFSFVEFKYLNEADTVGRSRFYYTQAGSLLFHASAAFEVDNSEAVIAQVEAALATLVLNANSSLRAASLRKPESPAATHDVLGRSHAPARPARLYRLPTL